MITKTAWKNVWRNKIRSFVVIASVAVGIFAGTFSVAVMEGAIAQRLDDALNHEVAHIQITHAGFRANNDLNFLLEHADKMAEKIRSLEEVEAVSYRLVVTGMANTASKSSGVIINGIDTEREKQVLGLDKILKEGSGSYLEKDDAGNRAYIGEDLAKYLNIIRFTLTDAIVDSLMAKGVPPETAEKLQPLAGTRFKNERTFRKKMESVFTREEQKEYGPLISEISRSFRKNARLALTFVDRDNYHTGGMFRINGLYDLTNNMLESTHVFVHYEDLARLTGIPPGQGHLIMVRLNDVDQTEPVTSKLKELFPGTEVMNWKQIQPELAMLEGMARMMYGFFMVIILAALAFGIVNTMLMVVLERTKELGMLAAIGMNKKKVFRMILTESVFLSLVGGVIGMIISKIVIALTARQGINFSGYKEGFEAMGFTSHIYPHIGNDFFILVTILIILTGILAAIYPALKALKLDPADALRTE